VYQLHSTPVQFLAELGGWGIILPVLLTGGIIWQARRCCQAALPVTVRLWTGGLSSALLSYGVVSLTDYQLDNVCISGIIVIYLACLLQLGQGAARSVGKPRYARWLFGGGISFVLVMLIWLLPILRAWQLSAIGFRALATEQVPQFIDYLTRAEALAPWEPYYPTQLGWNTGKLALQTSLPSRRQDYLKTAIASFERSLQASPYLEFTHNNLGWLQLGVDPKAASQAFYRGTQLVPAKRGLYYGLGLSLLAQQKIDLALQALTIECLRDPLFLTNPLWREPNFALLYPLLVQQVQTQLEELLVVNSDDADLERFLQQVQGGLAWWLGQFPKAKSILDEFGVAESRALLALSQNPDVPPNALTQFPRDAQKVIQAWQQPDQRRQLITQAWLEATKKPLPEGLLQQILTSLQAVPDFYSWLRQSAPVLRYRRQRLGFGVSQRHIDGPNPEDFYLVTENLPMVTWFNEMLPSPIVFPALDYALQPLREVLWQAIANDQ
jgi:hypothetical protein